MHTHTFIHTPTQTHTHLSVICMRWFLMHLGPRGSSHSNLYQHPLPWLFVCLSVCVQYVCVFLNVCVGACVLSFHCLYSLCSVSGVCFCDTVKFGSTVVNFVTGLLWLKYLLCLFKGLVHPSYKKTFSITYRCTLRRHTSLMFYSNSMDVNEIMLT